MIDLLRDKHKVKLKSVMADVLNSLGITVVKVVLIDYNVKDYLDSKIIEMKDDKAKELLALMLYDILVD